jgi:hypothetical protein
MAIARTKILVHLKGRRRRVVYADDVYYLEAQGDETDVRLRGARPLLDVRSLGEVMNDASRQAAGGRSNSNRRSTRCYRSAEVLSRRCSGPIARRRGSGACGSGGWTSRACPNLEPEPPPAADSDQLVAALRRE